MLRWRRVVGLISRGRVRGIRSGSCCLRRRYGRIRSRGWSCCLRLLCRRVRRCRRRNHTRRFLILCPLIACNQRPNLVTPMPSTPGQPGENHNWNDESQRRLRRRLVILEQIRHPILRRRFMRQAQHRSAGGLFLRGWRSCSGWSRSGRQLGPAHATERMLQVVHVPAFFALHRHRV